MLMVSGMGTVVFVAEFSEEAKDYLRKIGKDKSVAKGKWRCRCGSDNDDGTRSCTNCQRSISATF